MSTERVEKVTYVFNGAELQRRDLEDCGGLFLCVNLIGLMSRQLTEPCFLMCL